MKKLAVTLCLAALATGAFAQGTVNFQNGVGLNISTNATATGGTSGVTGSGANGYYYALFIAPSSVTSVDANYQDLLGGGWTYTNPGTNTGIAGRMSGGTGIGVPGWAPTATNSYVIVGWSASLGSSWATVRSELQGSTFSGGKWSGGAWAANGFFGGSVRGFGQAGGTDPNTGQSFLPFNLYGTTATASGTPVGGFSLFSVTPVPEPTTFALAGLGAAALVIFRRRKA